MTRRPPRPLSRLAIGLGVLALVASPLAWYYGLPLALAGLALLIGVVARVRGEGGLGALLWPLLALVAGTGVFVAYLITTGVEPPADAVIEQSFDQGFDDDFRNLVGDAPAGFGAPAATRPSSEDGGSAPATGAGSQPAW